MNMQACLYANVAFILVMITGGIILKLIPCVSGPPAFDLKLNGTEGKKSPVVFKRMTCWTGL